MKLAVKSQPCPQIQATMPRVEAGKCLLGLLSLLLVASTSLTVAHGNWEVLRDQAHGAARENLKVDHQSHWVGAHKNFEEADMNLYELQIHPLVASRCLTLDANVVGW